jgi:hypothetical protein
VVRRRPDVTVVGALLIALGVVALVEAWRLYALRTELVAGAVVGDDTFPFVVGGALVVLGLLAITRLRPRASVEVPEGGVRVQMIASAGLLVGYWLALPWLGYTPSTALASIGLYRTMGGYRWPITVLLGALTAGALHLLFRVSLVEPLPTGILGL